MTRGERGYSLVALLATVTIMMVMMAAAVPAWKYVVKNDREQELIFRGGQIADAIRRFQTKNGNALPPSLDALVKGKFLRRAYKDPMTKDGKWRMLPQGEALGGGAQGTRPPGTPGAPSPLPAQPPGGRTLGPGGLAGALAASPSGGALGPFVGVASLSKDKGLRLFNNRQSYNEWWFVAGQPRVIGRRLVGGTPVAQPGARNPQQPLQPQQSQRPGAAQPLR